MIHNQCICWCVMFSESSKCRCNNKDNHAYVFRWIEYRNLFFDFVQLCFFPTKHMLMQTHTLRVLYLFIYLIQIDAKSWKTYLIQNRSKGMNIHLRLRRHIPLIDQKEGHENTEEVTCVHTFHSSIILPYGSCI